MKNLCKDLRKHATKIIGCGKKVMLPMTDEENKSFHKQNFCYICKKISIDQDDKKHCKVKDHWHFTGKCRGGAHNICNLRYKTPNEIPVLFHNGYKYDYHFIINKSAEKFEDRI